MKAPIVDIKDMILAESSPIFTYETNLFLKSLQDQPNNCIVLQDSGGFSPDTGADIQKPTITVISRSSSYETAYAQLQTLYAFLHTMHNTTINSARYISIFATSGILPLGDDHKGRTLLSQNYRIDRTPTS